jgi:hypothetical protein
VPIRIAATANFAESGTSAGSIEAFLRERSPAAAPAPAAAP